MIRDLNIPWWARLFPTAIRSATISDAGLEIQDRHGKQHFEWTALPAPPSRSPIWFVHLVSLDTYLGARRFYFRTSKQRDSAWKQLSQAWYAPRVSHFRPKLTGLITQLDEYRYVRSSTWAPIKQVIQSWRRELPPVPPPGLLAQCDQEVLQEARSLVEEPDSWLEQLRDQYVETTLTQYHDLFETIESKPLTPKQRRACVIDEDNNLIMAGAGTGKTSTVIGRVAFLIKSGQANPEDILLLAYGKEAAQEMRERLEKKLGVNGITAATFHALGRCIVETVEKNH